MLSCSSRYDRESKSRGQGRVPILPDRLVTEAADAVGYLLWRTVVGDVELACRVARAAIARRPFARAELHNPAAFGAVQVFLARACVSAGFGVTAGAHQCYAKRNQAGAQLRRLARRQQEARMRKLQPRPA